VKIRIFLGTLLMVVGLMSSEAADERKRIVVLGDSLAAGSGVGKDGAYPAFVQKRIDQEKLPYTVINAGVDGDTSSGGLRRINWLLRKKVDVLLLELGGNDGLRGIDTKTTKANLIAIVARTRDKYPDVKVVIAGMQMPPNMGKKYTEAFKKIFPVVAKETKSALIPFLLEGIGADPKYNQPDLIHPTKEGHEIVAGTVWKVLGPVLKGK